MRDIKGYEGLYAVTSCGKVWSYRRQKFLKPWSNGTPYLLVTLVKDGVRKNRRLHRLVAQAYIDNPDPKHLKKIDHDNGNPHDNYVNNLKWADDTINGCNRRNNIPVHDIITGEDYCNLQRAVRATGLSLTNITKDCEHYKETGEARRFIYLKGLTYEEYNGFMRVFFEKYYQKEA